MSEKQWVQHISGQGEKWECLKDTPFDEFCVFSKKRTTHHYLPKSEYRLCDPPETWKDVTVECEADWIADNIGLPHQMKKFTFRQNGSPMGLTMRLRKVKAIVQPNEHAVTYAFIVEKLVHE